MTNIIRFVSNRTWLKKDSPSAPKPIMKTIPEWYRKADRFAKMPNGEYFKANKMICPVTKEGTTDDYGKIPTWKACPAIFDIMGTGYTLLTPCDIEFFLDDRNKIAVKVLDSKYQDFCTARPPMPQFVTPIGCYDEHFAWFPDWAVEVPEGYSVLYSQPFNRFELPTMIVSGIIDNDNINLPGSMPFFLKKDWTGILPAGTPFAQMIPFKREDWKSEIVLEDVSIMYNKNVQNSAKYRKPDGGVYKNEVWQQRRYE